MIWDDDIEPLSKRPVGRPAKNPFQNEEFEEDFIRRAESMIRLYYRPKGPNSRLDFEFGPRSALSKSQFWAIIFIYCDEKKIIFRNLQGFLNSIISHFGTEVICDRASIYKNICMQENLHVTSPHLNELTDRYQVRAQERYCNEYQYVVRKWESCLDI